MNTQSDNHHGTARDCGVQFASVDEILEDLRAGRMVVVVDAEDREDEGDLCLAAQFVTPTAIDFMVREAGGYLFVSLTEADCDRLDLHDQTERNSSLHGTPLTVSIDGHPRHGVGTGVSARDRARSIQLALDPRSTPDDFVRPGHINPLRSLDGGVLVRTGHTEALVDLCRLGGLLPAAVGIEICGRDGGMARRPDLLEFCRKHDLRMCSIMQIIEYRLRRETLVHRVHPRHGERIVTDHGSFRLMTYRSTVDQRHHYALVKGDDADLRNPDKPTLVRVHRAGLLDDVFGRVEGASEPSGHRILQHAFDLIEAEGSGVIVYLQPDASGWTAETQTQRCLGLGSQILRDLGLSELRLIVRHERALAGLHAFGLSVSEVITGTLAREAR